MKKFIVGIIAFLSVMTLSLVTNISSVNASPKVTTKSNYVLYQDGKTKLKLSYDKIAVMAMSNSTQEISTLPWETNSLGTTSQLKEINMKKPEVLDPDPWASNNKTGYQAGLVQLTAGTRSQQYYVKVNGDNVTLLIQYAQNDAVPKTMLLSDLVNNFYSTSEQKQNINSITNKIVKKSTSKLRQVSYVEASTLLQKAGITNVNFANSIEPPATGSETKNAGYKMVVTNDNTYTLTPKKNNQVKIVAKTGTPFTGNKQVVTIDR